MTRSAWPREDRRRSRAVQQQRLAQDARVRHQRPGVPAARRRAGLPTGSRSGTTSRRSTSGTRGSTSTSGPSSTSTATASPSARNVNGNVRTEGNHCDRRRHQRRRRSVRRPADARRAGRPDDPMALPLAQLRERRPQAGASTSTCLQGGRDWYGSSRLSFSPAVRVPAVVRAVAHRRPQPVAQRGRLAVGREPHRHAASTTCSAISTRRRWQRRFA